MRIFLNKSVHIAELSHIDLMAFSASGAVLFFKYPFAVDAIGYRNHA
jgi:hypothetical protein